MSLFSIEKILVIPSRFHKKFFSALFGSLYSCLILFFPFPFPFSFLCHISVLWIMIYIIFGKKKIRLTFLGVVTFIIAEVLIGGMVTATESLFSFFPKSGLRVASLILFIACGISLIYPYFQYLSKKRLKEISVKAKIEHEGKEVNVVLFIDSGNMARESVSRRRVIFIREDVIKAFVNSYTDSSKNNKCVSIPINTTTGRSTVLGFVPDRIKFSDKKYNLEEFVIVPDRQGCNFGGYDGIVPLL